ncbi:MAG: exosome complex RNA-binding protein Rrp4 [Candidatus Odinarchaeota archaeon]
MPVNFENNQIVSPGDMLAEGDYLTGEGSFKENNRVYSSILGLAVLKGKTVSVIPLQGSYYPKVGDIVIGKVLNSSPAGMRIDINSLYSAAIFPTTTSEPGRRGREKLTQFDVGENIIAKIISFDRTHDPILTVDEEGLGKLAGGRIIKIHPTRIPRVIGKKGSMIKLLKDEITDKIKIGQNGIIWFSTESDIVEDILLTVLKKIEREAHTSGLTDRVKELIKKLKEEKIHVIRRGET